MESVTAPATVNVLKVVQNKPLERGRLRGNGVESGYSAPQGKKQNPEGGGRFVVAVVFCADIFACIFLRKNTHFFGGKTK